VGDFVRHPERDQLGVETETLRFWVCYGGEVFETNERDAATIYYKFAGVSCSHSHHEQEIDINIRLK
jgi:hypothetical protein